ncbi:MAG: hypothetical protein JKX92_05345 [Porticoccaceae bacterium]|nr:hypothetical protein [Porticoccaceae bacterium]
MNTLRKHFIKVGIQKKSVLLAALLSLLFCLFILPLLYFQLFSLSESQLQLYGQTMSHQLLAQVRQPLLNDDAVSLQVVLDNLVMQTPMVKQAAVFKADDTLFAQSLEPYAAGLPHPGVFFQQVLNLANTANWNVQLSIDPGDIRRQVMTVFWSVSAVGLLLCILTLYWAQRLGGNISTRLQDLSASLPNDEASTEPYNEHDEISLLAKRIEPLLFKTPIHLSEANKSEKIEPTTESCCLAIRCINLPQLQAHLSHDNLQRVLKRFDDIIATTGELFKGKRLSGANNCVYLRFVATSGGSDFILRAISCHLALVELQREQADDEGAALILGSALASDDRLQTADLDGRCLFIEDTLIEMAQRHLSATSLLAEPWQLLVGETTKTKIPAEAGISFEALAGANNNDTRSRETFLFADLGSEQQALFERQLAYLRNRLSENDQPHWQHSCTDGPRLSVVTS